MIALYHVIEYGHRTSFLNKYAQGWDVPHFLFSALPTACDNGGNLTAALPGTTNAGHFYPKLSESARPLTRLDAEEVEEYEKDFAVGKGVAQRVTIDLDHGTLRFGRDRERQDATTLQSGEHPIPPEVMDTLRSAREAPTIRLKDLLLLGLPPANVYLVHKQSDVGTVSASGLRELTGRGRSEFADLLSAKVDSIRPGAYGVELVMTGICPERLVDFDRAQVAMLRAGSYSGLFQPEDQCPEEALEQGQGQTMIP